MTSALLHDFFSSNNQVRSTRRTWPGMTVLEKQSNILPFHQETQETAQETENRKALVIRAYNEDISSSDDDIVALTGVPKTTVWRYLKPYRDRAKTGEMPAISTSETA